MITRQTEIKMSKYMELYDILVPKDNKLRQIKEIVDFEFIYEEVKNKYCPDNGRNAKDPILLFKYLLLKVIDGMSDIGVVERSRYDLSYKYFLDMAPEETEMIDASTLTKFRKLRLKDSDLLDLLIGETVRIAREKGLIKSKNIIVDSTHTASKYNLRKPIEVLKQSTKKLRKDIYRFDEDIKKAFPEKPIEDDLETEIQYTNELLNIVEKQEVLSEIPSVVENIRIVKEVLEDINDAKTFSLDQDAKTGHKTSDTSFFGYKTHIAMTEDRIITSAIITSGEKPDGKELVSLIEKTKATGIEVEAVIGDTAYSEKSNLEYGKDQNIEIISKLHPVIISGYRKDDNGFYFNKDAGLFVCPQGHMATKVSHCVYKKHPEKTAITTYFFDVEKCKFCPTRNGCYKEGAATKSFTISHTHPTHLKQQEFMKTKHFKTLAKNRYMIEAKNAELKNSYGYDTANSTGISGMQLQGAITIFAANLRRIVSLSNNS